METMSSKDCETIDRYDIAIDTIAVAAIDEAIAIVTTDLNRFMTSDGCTIKAN